MENMHPKKKKEFIKGDFNGIATDWAEKSVFISQKSLLFLYNVLYNENAKTIKGKVTSPALR